MFPKFSIKQLLLAMIAFAALSACIAGAYRGDLISSGLSWGVVLTIIPLAFCGIVYWLAFTFATIFSAGSVAQDELSPAVVGAIESLVEETNSKPLSEDLSSDLDMEGRP
jgi:hypothetical protein